MYTLLLSSCGFKTRLTGVNKSSTSREPKHLKMGGGGAVKCIRRLTADNVWSREP